MESDWRSGVRDGRIDPFEVNVLSLAQALQISIELKAAQIAVGAGGSRITRCKEEIK